MKTRKKCGSIEKKGGGFVLDRSEVGKRGYLDRDFRLVHLKDF
ncbi:MAG: hypothetical protein V8R27_01605 [Oscillospiraceae bacterium]